MDIKVERCRYMDGWRVVDRTPTEMEPRILGVFTYKSDAEAFALAAPAMEERMANFRKVKEDPCRDLQRTA